MSTPTRADFRYLDRQRVRWAEVDMQKIVFNGHYLMYFDTAVAGYWRAMAMPYHETMERLEGDLYARKATLEYLASARYDDRIETGVRAGRIGNSSIVFHAAVFRGEQCLVHGELLYVFADPATQTSKPAPQALRDVLGAFENGAPMIDVRLGAWSELADSAQPIRKAVFVDEQRIPADLEWDAVGARQHGGDRADALQRRGPRDARCVGRRRTRARRPRDPAACAGERDPVLSECRLRARRRAVRRGRHPARRDDAQARLNGPQSQRVKRSWWRAPTVHRLSAACTQASTSASRSGSMPW